MNFETENLKIDMMSLAGDALAFKVMTELGDHMDKCFTFGKPLLYDANETGIRNERVEEIKRRFNRVYLIRKYHRITKIGYHRKFAFPVDGNGFFLNDK